MLCGRIGSVLSVIILAVMFATMVSASSKYIISNIYSFGVWQVSSLLLVDFSFGQITK